MPIAQQQPMCITVLVLNLKRGINKLLINKMNGFINPVSLLNNVEDINLNYSNGILPVKIENLDSDTNSVLFINSTNEIKGDSNIFKFQEDIKKLTVSDSLSYVSPYPIAIETGFDDDTYCTGIIIQNKNAGEAASAHIVIQNDIGTDSTNYVDFGINSSGATISYNQFASMKNAGILTSQSSNLIFSPNTGGQGDAKEVSNIILTYNNGQKAHILNDHGQIIIGANQPDYTLGGNYGGDDGGANKVLTSNGDSGLKWVQAPLFNVPMYLLFETKNFSSPTTGTTINLFSSSNLTVFPEYRLIIQFNANFSCADTPQTGVFNLINTTTSSLLQTYRQTLNNNHQHIPLQFNTVIPAGITSFSFAIQITTVLGTASLSIDTNDFYSIIVSNISPTS